MIENDLYEAERKLRSEIAQNPHRPETHIELSALLLKRNRTMDALAAADAALIVNRDLPDAHCARGAALLRMDQPVLATMAFRRALTIDPDHRDSLSYLSKVDGARYHKSVVVAPPATPWSGTLVTENPTLTRKISHVAQPPGQQLLFGRILRNGNIRDALALLRATVTEKDSFRSVIDFQSGDGLFVSQLVRKYNVGRVIGLNPSATLLERNTDETGFSALLKGEVATLDHVEGTFDLMIALNHFSEIGPLENWFAKIVPHLADKGSILYSIEVGPDAGTTSRRDGRFTHAKDYVERIAASHGLLMLSGQDRGARIAYGQVLPGYIGILRRV